MELHKSEIGNIGNMFIIEEKYSGIDYIQEISK